MKVWEEILINYVHNFLSKIIERVRSIIFASIPISSKIFTALHIVSVYMSVCLSVCDVGVSLDYFELHE